jgi:hypothetical protein
MGETRKGRKQQGNEVMVRRRVVSSLVAVVMAVTPAFSPLAAQSSKPAAPGAGLVAPGPQVNLIKGEEITPEQQAAVDRGLEWLARRQDRDGSFGGLPGVGGGGKHAGITALAGLAFMQGGNLPGRGKYGANVRKAMEFILASTSESGLITSDSSGSPMYGHGFATLFLAELYGMGGTADASGTGGDEELKEKLQRAVRLIVRAQNPQGGWRYQPVPMDADISVTICQIMALRAARDAGIKIERQVIDRAIQYVRNCQNADGGFSYMASMAGSGMAGNSGYARTAAGVASLFYAGVYQGDDIQRGLDYIKKYIPGKSNPPEGEAHYYYGNYYAVQAMFLAGGEYWAAYYPGIRDQLIARQQASGSWAGDFTEEYATSMALLILQMPNRYLPVFTGKGPGS